MILKYKKFHLLNESNELDKEDIILMIDDSDLLNFISMKTLNLNNKNDLEYLTKNRFRTNFRSIFDNKNTNFIDFIKILDNLIDSENNIIYEVEIAFLHPKRVRNTSFNYDGFINSIYEKLFKRIKTQYDMNIYLTYGENGLSISSNPIAITKLYFISN